jgi:hypothetical protein
MAHLDAIEKLTDELITVITGISSKVKLHTKYMSFAELIINIARQ